MGRYSEDLKAAVAAQPFTEAVLTLGEKEITLVAKPLTPHDLTAIKRQHPDFTQNPTTEGMVDLIILKARDGSPTADLAFDARDKPFLMRLDATVVGTVFGTLFGAQLDTNADEEIAAKKGN